MRHVSNESACNSPPWTAMVNPCARAVSSSQLANSLAGSGSNRCRLASAPYSMLIVTRDRVAGLTTSKGFSAEFSFPVAVRT